MAYGDYETYNRDIDVNNMVLVCPYCDSKQILSEYEMEAYCRLKGITPPVKVAPPVYNNMPNETIVMREYVPTPQPVYQPQPQPQNGKSNRILWIIGFCCAPQFTIPLWFIVTKRIPTKVKVIVGVTLLFIIIGAAT